MQMCQSHWDMLSDAIKDRGIYNWVAKDGETAAAQMASTLTTGELTKTNYDPLMASHNMILANALDMVGITLLGADEEGNEYCPICFLNSKRNPDGSCPCGKDDCGGKAPGSIPNFETWIGFSADGAKRFMVEEGWVDA